MKIFYFFFTLIFLQVFSNFSFGQFTDFHPQLDWYTIEGKNIQVHFHDGAERTAQVVAKIADEIWEPICSLYDYEPETVHYVIKDIDDYSNGATYFFDNKIEIWTSALDFDLRGTHNWLRNVISHEFVHLVQIQASMKASRNLPAVFFQLLSYEDERRPDILYGFPNVIVSYPLATINVPAWFAEGTAQYMRKEFNYDNWDSHRDMILRSYVLDDNMLTWNQMGVFGKTSLGNESVYNSGFALTSYIAQKYGEDKLKKISNSLGKLGVFTIDAAFEKELGKNGDEIYNEWKEYLTNSYNERTSKIQTNPIIGDTIGKVGFGNFYPTFSKDGKKVLYISNKSSDYFIGSALYLFDLETKKEKLISAGVRSTYSWIDDESKIVYSKITDNNPYWYNVHDIFIYDIAKDDEKRLTENLRANQPSVSNDGKNIVFLFQKDGTTNLGVVNIDGTNFRQITFFENGEQVYNPKYSNDDSYIIFDYSYHNTRDIAKISSNGGEIEFIVSTEFDERNPTFDSNGKLIYSSDETGIFNVYSLNLETGEKNQLTNVLGGAFMPSLSSNGDLAYSGYTSAGYKIFHLPKSEHKAIVNNDSYVQIENPPLQISKPFGDLDSSSIAMFRNFNDVEFEKLEKKRYSGQFSALSLFPFIRIDNYNTDNSFIQKIKPGIFVSSNDVLNRYSLFAGGSLNLRMERDLFLVFEYKNKLPLFTALGLRPELAVELYSVSRKSDQEIFMGEYEENSQVNYDFFLPVEITYDLFEFDFIARHRLFSRDQNLQLRFVYSQYIATIGSLFFPNGGFSASFKDRYFIGRNIEALYTWENILPKRDADINPNGFDISFAYTYEFNDFNNDNIYEVKDGLLIAQYNKFNFHRLELLSHLHIPTFEDHTINATFRAGSILGPTIPDFFDFYLGGLLGMKSYPFYSISGNEIGWLNLTYRFPLLKNIDTKIGHLYLDKIFLSFNGDIGNAWNGEFPEFNKFKKGVGAELRIQLNSYYLFPTSIFVNASYGLDSFEREVRDEIVSYGKEWNFYAGVLFGFEILNGNKNFRMKF